MTELVELPSPSRVAIAQGSIRHPIPPLPTLPSTDEASTTFNKIVNSRIERIIDRDKPVVYVQGEDCIWRYDPYQDTINVLLLGLKNPSGLWVAPTSDLVWLEDVKVTRPGEMAR